MPTHLDRRARRPSLYWAIIELHNCAEKWFDLEPANKIKGCRGPALYALLQTLIAFTHACEGREIAKHLARTRAGIGRCEAGFKPLEHLVPEIFVEAKHRIDQVVAGLEILEKLPHAEWRQLELPPLPGQWSRPLTGNTMERMRDISQRAKRAAEIVERRIQERRRYRS